MKEYEIPGHLYPNRPGNWFVIDGKLYDLTDEEVAELGRQQAGAKENTSGGESANEQPPKRRSAPEE